MNALNLRNNGVLISACVTNLTKNVTTLTRMAIKAIKCGRKYDAGGGAETLLLRTVA